MQKDSRIFVAGHKGLVGSALLKSLIAKGYSNILTRSHQELDLKNTTTTAQFFDEWRPEYVFLAAAKVGGILANNRYRADFIYENIMIQNNVIHQSYLSGVKKLLFLGSTCIYPKNAPQPIKESYLLTDSLEYTNEPYAIAKIAGIKMCESYNLQYGTNFLSAMPTNLYGPNDNFDLEKSHVVPALLMKMHLAKLLSTGNVNAIKDILNCQKEDEVKAILEKHKITSESVEIWGSGEPLREFLWSEDMADACIFMMEKVNFSDCYNPSDKEIRNTHINVGTGLEVSIKELALLIQRIVGFEGELSFNSSKPDGTMRKLTDVSKLDQLGWKFTMELEEGIQKLYDWFKLQLNE